MSTMAPGNRLGFSGLPAGCVNTKGSLELTPASELRNQIYICCINDTTLDDDVGYEIDWIDLCRCKGGPLVLGQTCKQIREEYLSLWMSTVSVRVRLSQLDIYLHSLYPLRATKHPHANVELVLPPLGDRVPVACFPRDLTGLIKSMALNNDFNCTVVHPRKQVSGLQDLLRNISRKAEPFLDSIVSVQLSSRNLYPRDMQYDLIHITFKEHQTLPGEWPWYGADNLNHESLLLWKKWSENLGISGSEGWSVDITVQPLIKDIERFTPIWIEGIGYTKPRQGGTMRLPLLRA